MDSFMKHTLSKPYDLINFIEQYLAYSEIFTKTMYELKNTALLTPEKVLASAEQLSKIGFYYDDKNILFIEINGIDKSFSVAKRVPTEFITKEAILTSNKAYVGGTIFHGNVEFHFTESLIFNNTFFNPDSVVKINERILTSDEIKCISQNVFDLCGIEGKIEIRTELFNLEEVRFALEEEENIRSMVEEHYKEGVEAMLSLSYDKAAYIPNLKKCLYPLENKIVEIDLSNLNEPICNDTL